MQIFKKLSAVTPPREWSELPLGEEIFLKVQEHLRHWLPLLHGDVMVKVGSLSHCLDTSQSAIPNQLSIGRNVFDHVSVVSKAYELPLESESVGLFVGAFVLDFTRHPHGVLRELHRCIDGEGHLILINFNAWSCWGVVKLAAGITRRVPWNAHFYSTARVHDWLNLLGFDIMFDEYICYGFPFKPIKLSMLEKLGPKYSRRLGAINIVVAKKKVYRMIPIQPEWKKSTRLVGQLT